MKSRVYSVLFIILLGVVSSAWAKEEATTLRVPSLTKASNETGRIQNAMTEVDAHDESVVEMACFPQGIVKVMVKDMLASNATKWDGTPYEWRKQDIEQACKILVDYFNDERDSSGERVRLRPFQLGLRLQKYLPVPDQEKRKQAGKFQLIDVYLIYLDLMKKIKEDGKVDFAKFKQAGWGDEPEICIYPHLGLRITAKQVTEITSEILQERDRMLQVLNATKGVGIAHPQLLLSNKQVPWPLIIVRMIKDGRSDWTLGREIALVNPEILREKGSFLLDGTGCLSFPWIRDETEFPEEVWVRGINVETGEEEIIHAIHYNAAFFVHEIDHVHGVTMIDRIKNWTLSYGQQKQFFDALIALYEWESGEVEDTSPHSLPKAAPHPKSVDLSAESVKLEPVLFWWRNVKNNAQVFQKTVQNFELGKRAIVLVAPGERGDRQREALDRILQDQGLTAGVDYSIKRLDEAFIEGIVTPNEIRNVMLPIDGVNKLKCSPSVYLLSDLRMSEGACLN